MTAEDRSDLPSLPGRPVDAHKGSFGTVLVIGGCATMPGAPAIAARAALRSGCGLARIATAAAVLPYCLVIEASATGLVAPATPSDWPRWLDDHLDERTVVAVGPGLGDDPGAGELLRALAAQERPVVCDADGLNALARLDPRRLEPRSPWVLTPHPGEYRRLAAAADIDRDPTDPQQRPQAAQELARAVGAVVVLKGWHSIVAAADRWAVNGRGGPALATAGSGDVLTGLIAALLAQGLAGWEAARLGCHLHGVAGELWAARHGPSGLLAHELCDLLPAAFQRHRRSACP